MANEATPIQSPHSEAAMALVEKIRALRAEVPRFLHAVAEENMKLVQKSLVPDVMIESASASAQTFARLESACGTTATTMRDAFDYAIAYDPVVREAFAFANSVAFTIRTQRAIAGSAALDVYALARRMSKQKDGAELVPHVEDMKHKLGKHKRTRKAISEPAPAPTVPSPQAPSTKV